MIFLTVDKESKNLHAEVTKGFVDKGCKFKYSFWIYRDKRDVCMMTMWYDSSEVIYIGPNVATCMEELIEEFVEVV